MKDARAILTHRCSTEQKLLVFHQPSCQSVEHQLRRGWKTGCEHVKKINGMNG